MTIIFNNGHEPPQEIANNTLNALKEEHRKEIRKRDEIIEKLKARMVELEDIIVEISTLGIRAKSLEPDDMERYSFPEFEKRNTTDSGAPSIKTQAFFDRTPTLLEAQTTLNQYIAGMLKEPARVCVENELGVFNNLTILCRDVLGENRSRWHLGTWEDAVGDSKAMYEYGGFVLPPTDPKNRGVYRVLLFTNKIASNDSPARRPNQRAHYHEFSDQMQELASKILYIHTPKHSGRAEIADHLTMKTHVPHTLHDNEFSKQVNLLFYTCHVVEFIFKNRASIQLLD